MYKLLVLDIDGTLLNSQKQISQQTLDAILQAKKQGTIIVIASGRPTNGVLPLARQLDLMSSDNYILSFNGANIINVRTMERVFTQSIPQEHLQTIYDFKVEHNLPLITYTDTHIVTDDNVNEFITKEMTINNMPLQQVPNLINVIDFAPTKFLGCDEPDKLQQLEPIAAAAFPFASVYRSEPFFLEIMPKNVDKAYSLSKLLDILHIDKSEMICCGDGFNDKTMIQYAGLGVAMANAQPQVKEVADFITDSNDEDGIAKVIHEFILK